MGLNMKNITENISHLLQDRKLMEQMGKHGQDAVLTKFNWNSEEKKIISCYQKLI